MNKQIFMHNIKKNKIISALSKLLTVVVLCSCMILVTDAQTVKTKSMQGGKKISPDLFGLFFEDINYAADGGLYAEQVQNRSFEYNPTERREWNPLSFWTCRFNTQWRNQRQFY